MKFAFRLPKSNRVVIYCISSLLVILLMTYSASACWVWLSVQEMIDKSTAIVVGEVIGRTDLNVPESTSVPWKVKVRYCIKGNIKDEYVKVLTPPENTSLHYGLNQWGREVILFLNAGGEYYTPLSPQAVISIEIDEEKLDNKSITSGTELLEGISIRSNIHDSEFAKEIEDYIRNSTISQPELKAEIDRVDVEQKDSGNHIILISGISSLTIISAGFVFIMMFKRGNK